MQRQVYTALDLRLGLVQLTDEQQQIVRERVQPILIRAAQRELDRRLAEQATQRRQIASGE